MNLPLKRLLKNIMPDEHLAGIRSHRLLSQLFFRVWKYVYIYNIIQESKGYAFKVFGGKTNE